MAKPKSEYWFKAKKYGWGWGLPQNTKGWISFGIFVAVWLAALLWLVTSADVNGIPADKIVVFVVIIIADIAGLLYVSFTRGEKPSWKWGNKHGKSKS